jgi:DNA repair protein RecO (recombination protein O)
MRPVQVTPAIVLRSWSFGESDRIVSFLTESHGKLTGIAKGAKRSKKRFINSLEPFSLVRLRFQDNTYKSLAFILACELEKSYKNLISSLEKIAVASYCVEITEGLLPEREENRVIFEHLKKALTRLEIGGPSLMFLMGFELKLLHLAGYQPVLDSCRCCGLCRPRSCEAPSLLQPRWHFSLSDGGVLCENCSKLKKEILPLSDQTLDLMTDLQQEQSVPANLVSSTAVLKQARAVVLRFIQFHMDKDIKSARFLHQFYSESASA